MLICGDDERRNFHTSKTKVFAYNMPEVRHFNTILVSISKRNIQRERQRTLDQFKNEKGSCKTIRRRLPIICLSSGRFGRDPETGWHQTLIDASAYAS